MTNEEMLKRANDSMSRLGIHNDPNGARQAAAAAREDVRKSETPQVPTTSSLATGDFMDRTMVERLVDLTVGQSDWLSTVSLRLRSQKKGEIPRINLSEVVTEGVSENGGSTITTHPDTDRVTYETAKFQATWYITLEDIREARASGEPDFDGKFMRAFAKAMGNDMARWTLRGDTSLAASSRLNRLLRQRDGWLKKARASGVRSTTTRGSAFSNDLFYAMLAAMPEQYREDANLRWLMCSQLDIGWQQTLSGYAANASQLGERQLTERRRFSPLGIDQLIVPQMPTDLGYSVLSGSTADPDTITDDGDGTITADVSTALGGYAVGNAGRRVKITYDATGQSETLIVVNSGGANVIHTVGSLGQSTISGTEADYTLDLADITPALLTNPGNLFLVMLDQVRAYRKFEQEFERWRVDVYYEADAGIFNEDAIVLQDGVVAPSFSFGS